MHHLNHISALHQRVVIFSQSSDTVTQAESLDADLRLAQALARAGCTVVLVADYTNTSITEDAAPNIRFISISLEPTKTEQRAINERVTQVLSIYKPSLVLVSNQHSAQHTICDLTVTAGAFLAYWQRALPSDLAQRCYDSFLSNNADLSLYDAEILAVLQTEKTTEVKQLIFENEASYDLIATNISQFLGQKAAPRINIHNIKNAHTSLVLQKLSNQPLIKRILVNPKETVAIKLATDYLNCANHLKKAVVTFNCFDSNGSFLHKADGYLQYSKVLKSFYTYLPTTDGQVKTLYRFVVPDDVAYLEIGVRLFNTKADELVLIHAFYCEVEQQGLEVDYSPPSAKAAAISILGWPAPPKSNKPIVMGIMDEFTTGCFEQDVTLIQPRPDNWFALMEKFSPELVFIESAWKGNLGSWQYRVAEYANQPGKELSQLASYARSQGIPVVFWNKEDPVHHDKFMQAAKLADHIFTTDSNMIPSYQRRTRNPSVHSLAFAAQPVLHKPAALKGRKAASCFAGSWYGNRHAERGESMGWLLKAANTYPLDIYDRNFGTGVFPFPDVFSDAIRGSLPYLELCKEYNQYRVFLNVNSVTDSPTMFSRRVFELMACGTPVVSTFAKGIAETFDSDAVWLIESEQEAEHAINTLLHDDNEWRRRSLAGIREVYSNHTYAHRFEQVFAATGRSLKLCNNAKVAILVSVTTSADLVALEALKAQQTYKNVIVIALTEQESFASESAGTFLVSSQTEVSEIVKSQSCNFVASMQLQQQYGAAFLQDLINATVYQPDAAFWGVTQPELSFSFGQPVRIDTVLVKPDNLTLLFNSTESWIKASDGYAIDSDQVVIGNVLQGNK